MSLTPDAATLAPACPNCGRAFRPALSAPADLAGIRGRAVALCERPDDDDARAIGADVAVLLALVDELANAVVALNPSSCSCKVLKLRPCYRSNAALRRIGVEGAELEARRTRIDRRVT